MLHRLEADAGYCRQPQQAVDADYCRQLQQAAVVNYCRQLQQAGVEEIAAESYPLVGAAADSRNYYPVDRN